MSNAAIAKPISTSTHRYERKFEGTVSAASQVELIVRMHPAHFREAYPPREINNIYFDTPNLASFTDHVMGAARRSKLRLRWYGQELGHIEKPVLEVKLKDGHVGTKQQYRLPPADFSGVLDLPRLHQDAKESGAAPTVVERLAASSPTLLNRYRRKYYVSADGRFRVTIDTGLSFRVINGRYHGFRNRYTDPRLIIVELKYAAKHDEGARDIGGGLPFRVSKLSKYIHGLVCLGRFEP